MNGEQAIRAQRSVEMLHSPDAGSGPLRFGTGIHTGEVIAGNIDALPPVFHMAEGDTTDISKRLQENTRPGQIVFCDPIDKTLGHRILARPASSINIKGHGDSDGRQVRRMLNFTSDYVYYVITGI